MALRLFLKEIEAAKKLRNIKNSKAWGETNAAGLAKRIEFLVTLFQSNLCQYVRSYELFDDYGIGERDFDTCFEMHDGAQVVNAVIDAARKDPALKKAIIRDMGKATFDSWDALTPKTIDLFVSEAM